MATESDDDSRLMEFVLMKLKFYDSPSGESTGVLPNFARVTAFRTAGVVMNVFLLDPIARLLSAFVWVSSTNTIGLYALPDWDKPEYIFVDTGIECVCYRLHHSLVRLTQIYQVTSSNWSCILYERNIVIHCEESERAYQYFYPLHLLQMFSKPLKSPTDIPEISYMVSPAKTLCKRFLFPHKSELALPPSLLGPDLPVPAFLLPPILPVPPATTAMNGTAAVAPTSTSVSATATPSLVPLPQHPNPFPFPPWCPDSAHFVRQWWPSLPSIPRVSCTVVLLAAHDQETHRTRFVLAQHYFKVPLDRGEWVDGAVKELAHRLVGKPHRLNRIEGEEREQGRGVEDGTRGSSRSGSERGAEEDEEAVSPGLVSGSRSPGGDSSEASGSGEGKVGGDDGDDEGLMHLWYVSMPFEVVCVVDGTDEDDIDEGGLAERPRPLVAVDFGHAVWIEFVDNEDDVTRPRPADSEAKWLRFVTFPPFGEEARGGGGGVGDHTRWAKTGGEVRTLEIPDDLDLDCVETINIDQSQGAVILSVRDGKIFILCYE